MEQDKIIRNLIQNENKKFKGKHFIHTIFSEENNAEFKLLYKEWQKDFLNHANLEKCDLDWIICECLEIERNKINLIQSISNEQKIKIDNAIEMRKRGIPIQRIFGIAYFYGYKFLLNDDCLIPRFDTEILVETVIKCYQSEEETKADFQILDLCTGSGCIAVALKKNIKASIFGSDINKNALNISKINADLNNVNIEFIQSNLFEKIDKHLKFDYIVSNPPYIKTDDINKLQSEVKNHDPFIALDGGIDGFDFYKKIINDSILFLKENGKLFLEIGDNQTEFIENLLKTNYCNIKFVNDLQGIKRVVYACKK